ncbi:E3 ubiquitin-protein ligase RNF126 isoform X3 [Microtus pennsylvanicus]|uniref:E3 ubiquitin-protein ligase RNF126 isoform X3 n=1 Tax=Microtus pennsylvanicus TaxID=10058 RepID=UPI003F6B9DC0
MAEASPQPGRYFCHCCSVEIVPRLPDYICPRCESGFIEELPEETRNTENGSAPSTASTDQNRQPFELSPIPSPFAVAVYGGLTASSPQSVDQHLFTLPQGYSQFAFGIFDDSFEIPTFPPGAQADDGRDPESRREREHQSRHRYGARQPRARLTARRATGRHEGVPTLEGIIQQLVNGIISPAAVPSLGLGPCSSINLRTRAPHPQTRRRFRPSPQSPSQRNTWAQGWSAPCAKTTTHWARSCGSCPATTCSMTAALCPG